MDSSSSSSPLTQLPSSSSSSSASSSNTPQQLSSTVALWHAPKARSAAQSASQPAAGTATHNDAESPPASISLALFGSSSSVFEMTNANVSTLLPQADQATVAVDPTHESASVIAAMDKRGEVSQSQLGSGRRDAGMETDAETDVDMDMEMQMQQSEKEDSPYPFAFAVPELQAPTVSTAVDRSNSTSSNTASTNDKDKAQDKDHAVPTSEASSRYVGYHAFLPSIDNNGTSTSSSNDNDNVPTFTYVPAIASFYSPGNTSSANAYLGMSAMPGRGYLSQQQQQQQQYRETLQGQAWSSVNPANTTASRTFFHSQSMYHLFPSTPAIPPTAVLPSVSSVPSMSNYPRTAVPQSHQSGTSQVHEYNGLFVHDANVSSITNGRGFDKAKVYGGHVTGTGNEFGGLRKLQYDDSPTSVGYQQKQYYQPERQHSRTYASVASPYPLVQHQLSVLPQQRQDIGSFYQPLSEPTFNPFMRPTTNDSNHSVGGYIVNEAEGQGGRYTTLTGPKMNGGLYMHLAPPSTADSIVFNGGATSGRLYVPVQPQQCVAAEHTHQPSSHPSYAHHQRQTSTDSLLLEELSTANTTPVFTPSTFHPAFLPSTSVAYAPSPRPSRNPGQGGHFEGEDVEMRESLGPTLSISTERGGREETIGVAGRGYRSPSPKRGRRRGEAKPGPNFLTKLYAILNDPAYHHMLHWAEDGVQVIIRNPKEMEARVLPLVYKQSKFASFSRQLNIYGFMRKVSMRHVDMARDSDVSVWTHYELNRYSSAGKLMSYKRRVGPRHYARKTGPQAPASSTKNFLFPNGVPDGVRYESIAPPSALMSPQQLALATATPATPSCQVLAFGSPYSVSTNIIYQQCLPDTSASVSPVRPIRTHGKGHKMSAGTLPMPSFHSRSSSGMYPNGGRNVPQNSIASQHSVFSSSNRSGTSKSVKIEDTMGDYSSTGILQGGLWQSLLGNASMPQAQMNNNVQFPSGLFPTLGSPEYPLARASFQPLVGSTYTQMGNAHAQSMNVSSRQSARPLAPSTAQMVYPPGHYVPVGSNGHTPNQPSRTLSNSSTSSSMLMTPPRLETFKIETEQVDQSPVFASFSLSLGHLSQGNYSNAISGGMDNTIEMQQVEQAAENEKNLTIAGNQVFASFLHDMGSSPAPSAAETHTETRPTPAVAMHVSSPETDQDSATHEMFINSFETVRPQAMKPSSSSKMQVVIADIEETENDMRYFEQTFRSRQVKLAGDQAQRQGAANALAVVKKEGRSLDEQDLNDGLRPRGGSFMDKTLRQADGYDDSAACEFDAWMVVQHTMDA